MTGSLIEIPERDFQVMLLCWFRYSWAAGRTCLRIAVNT